MDTIIQAIYEGGVLRPTRPLALPEGEMVDVIITQSKSLGVPLREPTPAEQDYAKRINEAKSLKEMFAVMETAPLRPEDDIDIVKEINETRRLTGFRMPDPDPDEDDRR